MKYKVMYTATVEFTDDIEAGSLEESVNHSKTALLNRPSGLKIESRYPISLKSWDVVKAEEIESD